MLIWSVLGLVLLCVTGMILWSWFGYWESHSDIACRSNSVYDPDGDLVSDPGGHSAMAGPFSYRVRSVVTFDEA